MARRLAQPRAHRPQSQCPALLFEEPLPITNVVQHALDDAHADASDEAAVLAAIDELIADRLVMRDGALLLALPLPATPFR